MMKCDSLFTIEKIDDKSAIITLKRLFYIKNTLDVIYQENPTSVLYDNELKNLQGYYQCLKDNMKENLSKPINFKGLINDALNLVQFMYGVNIEETMPLRNTLNDERISEIKGYHINATIENITQLAPAQKKVLQYALYKTIEITKNYQKIYQDIKSAIIGKITQDSQPPDIHKYMALLERAIQIKLATLDPKDVTRTLSILPNRIGLTMLFDIYRLRNDEEIKKVHEIKLPVDSAQHGKSYADVVKQKSELTDCNKKQLYFYCDAYKQTYPNNSAVVHSEKQVKKLRRSNSSSHLNVMKDSDRFEVTHAPKMTKSSSTNDLYLTSKEHTLAKRIKNAFTLTTQSIISRLPKNNNRFKYLATNAENDSLQSQDNRCVLDSIQENKPGEKKEQKKQQDKRQKQKAAVNNETQVNQNDEYLNQALALANEERSKLQSSAINEEKEQDITDASIYYIDQYLRMLWPHITEWRINIKNVRHSNLAKQLNSINQIINRLQPLVENKQNTMQKYQKLCDAKYQLELCRELIFTEIIPYMIKNTVKLIGIFKNDFFSLDVKCIYELLKINALFKVHGFSSRMMRHYIESQKSFLRYIKLYDESCECYERNDSDLFNTILEYRLLFVYSVIKFHTDLHNPDTYSSKNTERDAVFVALNNCAKVCDIESISKMGVLPNLTLKSALFITILNLSIEYGCSDLSYLLQQIHCETAFEKSIMMLFHARHISNIFEKKDYKKILNHIRLISMCYEKLTPDVVVYFFNFLTTFMYEANHYHLSIRDCLKNLFIEKHTLLDLVLSSGTAVRCEPAYQLLFDEMRCELELEKRFCCEIYSLSGEITVTDAHALYNLEYHEIKELGAEAQIRIMNKIINTSVNYKHLVTQQLNKTLSDILINVIRLVGADKIAELLIEYDLFNKQHHISLIHIIMSHHVNEVEYVVFMQCLNSPTYNLLQIDYTNTSGETPLHVALRHNNYNLALYYLAAKASLLATDHQGVSCAQLLFHPKYRVCNTIEHLKFIDAIIPTCMQSIALDDDTVWQKTHNEIIELTQLEDSNQCTLLECLLINKLEHAVTYFLKQRVCISAEKIKAIYNIAHQNQCSSVLGLFKGECQPSQEMHAQKNYNSIFTQNIDHYSELAASAGIIENGCRTNNNTSYDKLMTTFTN